MKPHKHAELIKAWADGAEIEYKMIGTEKWVHLASPGWFADEEYQYRIKPEPKPDFVHATRVCRHKEYPSVRFDVGIANLKLIFDGETGELKSAEVLK